MDHDSGTFVGIDTSKLRNAVAVAEEGRSGDVRYLGEIDTTAAATRKLVAKLAAKYRQVTFCYEAGPTGYGLSLCLLTILRLLKRLYRTMWGNFRNDVSAARINHRAIAESW